MNKLILIFLLTPLITFGQKGQLKKYDHVAFSIEYPANWKLDDSRTEGMAFVLYPNTETAKGFIENSIFLTEQSLAEDTLTPELLKALLEDQAYRMSEKTKIYYTKITSEQGFLFHKLIFAAEMDGMHVKINIHTYYRNNKLYRLTFHSKSEDYWDLKDAANQIMNSFTLK